MAQVSEAMSEPLMPSLTPRHRLIGIPPPPPWSALRRRTSPSVTHRPAPDPSANPHDGRSHHFSHSTARRMQVNLSEPYCGRLGGRANNWNLVLGCFHGVVRDLEYSRKILGNQV